MKFLGILVLSATLFSSAFASPQTVVGKASVVRDVNPYSDHASPFLENLIHEAKINALMNAMDQCGSETVNRTSAWDVIQAVQQPPCEPYYDTCAPTGNIHYAISAQATYECLAGPTPDLK